VNIDKGLKFVTFILILQSKLTNTSIVKKEVENLNIGSIKQTNEYRRLIEDKKRKAYWRRWGPYLSERQWATVREDYSINGDAWNYFPHDHARSRAYRWGEDGLAGISDNHQRLCFAIALWNEKDPILKERLFGLSNNEGNHGEDVKEHYYYLDSTPTHSYMKFLYKYPQSTFPYEKIVETNRKRNGTEPEYELLDTGIFDENRYFDVFVEYAKRTDEDILIKIEIFNRGRDLASIHVIPSIWFRNTWTWKKETIKPILRKSAEDDSIIEASHPTLGTRWLYSDGKKEILFTENETNSEKLFGVKNDSKYSKDAFHEYVINGKRESINPLSEGTKAGLHYKFTVEPNKSVLIRLRLTNTDDLNAPFDKEFDSIFEERKKEADIFYSFFTDSTIEEPRNIQRQAFAGLLWNKQWYHYIIEEWLSGDEKGPPPPNERQYGRNHEWEHLFAEDILSMPDKWEYPWFAAWDIAFHLITFALIDPDYAKKQLILLTREWYMHPNGQIPAYEWNFSDVNPPVHAWAAWRIYEIEKKVYGNSDNLFLERVFQKLLLNFTWWVNQKDKEGKNVFQGCFLGLDNIGLFDRSAKHLEEDIPFASLDQADGTAWMGMYCLNMMRISLELAQENPSYEDTASKFFEHFLYIANSMEKVGLWNEEDGFYYDIIHQPNGGHWPIKVRSLVGLIPLYGVEVIDKKLLEKVPEFEKRMEWFIENRKDLSRNVICGFDEKQHIFSVVTVNHLSRILKRLFDTKEFLSPHGIRSLSKYHEQEPFKLSIGGHNHIIKYEPAESNRQMFGGNSNWRGPIWFPVNLLIIESLQKFHKYLGNEYVVDFPTDTGTKKTLLEISQDLCKRLIEIFLPDDEGNRPVYGNRRLFNENSAWKNYLLFYEYFDGNNGRGLGASHQTGWTSLIANLINEYDDSNLTF